MPTSPLDRPPSLGLIQDWHQRGLITAETHRALLAQLRPAPLWRQWASWNLLGLGTTLLLAGIIFFFAYNWQGMTRLERLAVAQVGLFGAAIASRIVGSRTLPGHMLMVAACVMIGVVLAVFGQAYQTGADTYGLFTGWAALMLVWVVAQCFAPLWIVWLSVLSTGIWLYIFDVSPWPEEEQFRHAFAATGLLHLVALVVREGLLMRGADWLSGTWLRMWLLLAVLANVTVPAVVWAYTWELEPGRAAVVALWALTTGVGFYVYRYRLPSLGALGLILCSGCAVLLSLLAKVFFTNDADLGIGMLYGLVATGVLGAMVAWLRALGQQMNKEQQGGQP
jgi:uncharacterized membrane protein